MRNRLTMGQLSAQLGEAVAAASPQTSPAEAEAPRDSIEGAIQGLLHSVIDSIVSQTPRNMQTTTSVDRGKHPVKIELKGRNSQGLFSRLMIAVDLDQAAIGIRAQVQLLLTNAQGVPVANPAKVFMARRTDSVKTIVQQFKEWLTQVEALQMAPVPSMQVPGQPQGMGPPAQPAAML